MMNRALLCGAVLWTVLISNVAGPYVQRRLPLEELCASADVIETVTVIDLQTRDVPPHAPGFALAVERVALIKDDGQPVPARQHFAVFAVEQLPPRASGPEPTQTLVLFLTRDSTGALQPMQDVHAILPVYAYNAVDAAAPPSPLRGLFDAFQKVVETQTDPGVRAKYIALMAACATPEDREIFRAYLGDSHFWVRLSASLAWARIDPQAARAEAVADLLEGSPEQLESGTHELFAELFSDVTQVARCRAFGMDETMAARARAYLPIYRYFVDRAERACMDRPIACPGVATGIEALAAVGTPKDLPRLWRFRDSAWAPLRHDTLEGLARILGHPTKRPEIRSYTPGETLPENVRAWEAQTLAGLEAALQARQQKAGAPAPNPAAE